MIDLPSPENAQSMTPKTSCDIASEVEDWNQLDNYYKEFIIRVRNGGGCKRAADPHYYNPPDYDFQIALWDIPEQRGFIECIGSFKWIITEKYKRVEKFLLGIK